MMVMAAVLSIVTKPYNSSRQELQLLASEVLQQCDAFTADYNIIVSISLLSLAALTAPNINTYVEIVGQRTRYFVYKMLR